MFLENIKELVHVLVIIIVLGVFIEMLLPSSQMHDYVKMVMGLLIIVVVLEAGAKLVQQEINFELPALSQRTEGPPLEKIISQGQELAGKQKEQAMSEYQRGLEKQVLALARLQNNLNISGAQVKTADDPQDKDYGRLTEITLNISRETVDSEANTVQRVKPVDITVGADSAEQEVMGGTPVNTEQAQKLARTVANFYNIPIEKVKIVEETN